VGFCESGLQDFFARLASQEEDLMYSRPFSLTACLLLLWLFFSSPMAEANQSEKRTASPENVGSDVAKLRDQADGGDAIAE